MPPIVARMTREDCTEIAGYIQQFTYVTKTFMLSIFSREMTPQCLMSKINNFGAKGMIALVVLL